MAGNFAAKLFRYETMFNFHMNNFGAIIRKTNMALTTILLVKKRLLLLKSLNQIENKNGRKKKRFWVRKLYAERLQKGEFHLLVRDLRLHDHEYFFKYFRMSPTVFEELLSCLSPIIVKQRTAMRDPISPSERLAVTLRYLVKMPNVQLQQVIK